MQMTLAFAPDASDLADVWFDLSSGVITYAHPDAFRLADEDEAEDDEEKDEDEEDDDDDDDEDEDEEDDECDDEDEGDDEDDDEDGEGDDATDPVALEAPADA